MYWYNPIFNKVPEGPSQKNKVVTYTLKIAKQIGSTSAIFNCCKDYEDTPMRVPMKAVEFDNYIEYTASVKFETAGLYWYCFEVFQGEHQFFLQKTPSFDVEPTGYAENKFQQLVYNTASKTSDSYKGGVMYHIFVDRFCKEGKVVPHTDMVLRSDWGGDMRKNSDDFLIINKECFGGNLKGIEKKLDYIKSLNVSTIYLSPIFEANSYHKYDTADYSKVDSMFGTEQDLCSLIKKAKAKDIRIILDGAFNHTGDDSIYFNKTGRYKTVGAYQSKKSPYYNWYSFQEFPEKYDAWWGIGLMPQIKKGSPHFTKFIAGKDGIIEKYMKLGIFGFRLDVADELAENTLSAICKAARGVKPDCLMLGEVWEDASNKIAYDERKKYFLGGQLDSVMNYPMKDAIIKYVTTGNPEDIKNVLYMIKDHYPKDIQDNLMNILGSHDTPRILSILQKATNNDPNISKQLLKIATLIQYTVMGVPCLFYGDEQGVLGDEAPFCRTCFPWGKENGALKNWFEMLGNLRKHIVFQKGKLNVLMCEDGVLGYERVWGQRKIVIYVNATAEEKTLELPEKFTNYETTKQTKLKTKLYPYKYLILVK